MDRTELNYQRRRRARRSVTVEQRESGRTPVPSVNTHRVSIIGPDRPFAPRLPRQGIRFDPS